MTNKSSSPFGSMENPSLVISVLGEILLLFPFKGCDSVSYFLWNCFEVLYTIQNSTSISVLACCRSLSRGGVKFSKMLFVFDDIIKCQFTDEVNSMIHYYGNLEFLGQINQSNMMSVFYVIPFNFLCFVNIFICNFVQKWWEIFFLQC